MYHFSDLSGFYEKACRDVLLTHPVTTNEISHTILCFGRIFDQSLLPQGMHYKVGVSLYIFILFIKEVYDIMYHNINFVR